MNSYFDFLMFSRWVTLMGFLCLLLLAALPNLSPLPTFALYTIVGMGGGLYIAKRKTPTEE